LLNRRAPSQSEDAFIETTHVKHLWQDSPLFMFDDTLLHRSVNDTDETRYCAFIDILRPSYAHILMSSMMACIAAMIKSYRGMFYKNWDML
jgi:beta-hydroxylase